jgi:hypothetical protein
MKAPAAFTCILTTSLLRCYKIVVNSSASSPSLAPIGCSPGSNQRGLGRATPSVISPSWEFTPNSSVCTTPCWQSPQRDVYVPYSQLAWLIPPKRVGADHIHTGNYDCGYAKQDRMSA